MTILKTISAATVAATMMIGAANASSVIDFTGTDLTSGVGSSSGTFDNGAFSGTVDAVVSGFCLGDACNSVINQDSIEGLGITRNTLLIPDDPSIDSIISESMIFTFSETVVFDSIAFGFVDSEDDWTILINGVVVADESNVNPFLFAPGTSGTTLTVTALFSAPPDVLFGPPDDFNVKSISVSAIPLPAAGWMLLLGVGGLAAVRRKAANRA